MLIFELGAFGKVRLARKVKQGTKRKYGFIDDDETSSGESEDSKVIPIPYKQDDDQYAIKILSKYQIMEAKQVDHVFNEMNIHRSLNHPFIVNLIKILPIIPIGQHERHPSRFPVALHNVGVH